MTAEMPPVVLTPAGIAHAGLLAALHAVIQDGVWDEPPWDAANWHDLLAMPGAFSLLASTPPDSPVGFALGRVVADEAELIAIGVIPAARGRGIGRLLLHAVTAHARGAAAATLFLEVAAPNRRARALYHGAGFALVGRRPNYYLAQDGVHDALVLRLSLTGQRT